MTDTKVELCDGDVLMHKPPNAVITSKAADPNEEQYSAFNGRDAAGRTLGDNLRILKAARAFIGGVAPEYGVFNTGSDILKEKYKLFFSPTELRPSMCSRETGRRR